MKRSGFSRKQIERKPSTLSKPARWRVPQPIQDKANPVLKDEPVRHEEYRRLVASLPCANCGIEGKSQAAHPNLGKGLAIKASDVLCFPLCGPSFCQPGCHAELDQGGKYSKQERRELEMKWAKETQAKILAMGLWPLELWLYEWKD